MKLNWNYGLYFQVNSKLFKTISSLVFNTLQLLTLFHKGGGGGGVADSALLQIVFFITSVRDAAEPRNLVTFPKI